AERMRDRARQDALDEGIAFQDQRFAIAGCPEFAKRLARGRHLVKILKARGGAHEFHESKAAHEIRPARGKVIGQRRAPVLRNEIRGVDAEPMDKGIEIVDVIEEAVSDVGLAGLAKPDQIRRDAMRDRRHKRHDMAPDVGRSRIAMQEQRHRRVWVCDLAIGHGAAQNGLMANQNVGLLDHDGSLNTVWKAMVLKRSSAAGLRSTFMRSMAPCQDASRNSARSPGSKSDAISLASCA